MKAKHPHPEDGYLCDRCARSRGWKWPEGHVATIHGGECPSCRKQSFLACEDDWLRKNEKTVPLTRWD